MIYAIHNTTKEHSLVTWKRSDWDYDWRIVEADPDGWIPWHGGECPLPDGAAHEIKMRDGEISQLDDEADSWCWEHHGGEGDIIAYRPVLDADTKVAHPGALAGPDKYRVPGGEWPEPPAWNGEGLPPVGCEVEISRDSQLYEGFMEGDKVEVLAHKRAKAAEVAVVWSDTAGKSAQLIAEMFRPIRSEEDRVVEEMMGIWSNTPSIIAADGMRALYRAGYRKENT